LPSTFVKISKAEREKNIGLVEKKIIYELKHFMRDSVVNTHICVMLREDYFYAVIYQNINAPFWRNYGT